MSDLSAVDADLFAQCLGECVQFACALVAVGRDPVARELAELFAGPIADVVAPFVASKNIVGRETDAEDEAAGGDDDAEVAAAGADDDAALEYNSPGTSGDDGPGALEPNDDEEERAADPA